MKKNLILYAIAALPLLFLFSCERIEYHPLGQWRPIKASQKEINFDANGGSCSVKCKNYDAWHVSEISIPGTDVYYRAAPNEDYSYWMAACDGIRAETSPEGENTVIISVEPSSEKHSWAVSMNVGDAWFTISVTQN